MRRAGLVALLLAGLLVLLPARDATAATAQDGGSSTTLGPDAPDEEPHMIPRPNSGHEPVDAGDRGGSLQLLVLGLLVVAVGGGVAYVVRESRRARTARDAGGARPPG